MSNRRPFHEMILAHVDDDAPRLVFADWLDENGDPARAEFIRVQCERASVDDDDPRRVACGIRESNLVSKHGRDWVRGLVPDNITWGQPGAWRRGFPGEVTFTLTQFAGTAEAMIERELFPNVTVGQEWPRRPERVDPLIDSPWLRQIRSLGLSTHPPALHRFFASSTLDRLDSVTLSMPGSHPELLRTLLESPLAGRLKRLTVVCDKSLEGEDDSLREVARLLADSPALIALHTLELCGADQRTAAERLIASPHLSRELRVSFPFDQQLPRGLLRQFANRFVVGF